MEEAVTDIWHIILQSSGKALLLEAHYTETLRDMGTWAQILRLMGTLAHTMSVC